MTDKPGPAFELKGTAATLTVLRLKTVDVARIAEQLRPRVAQLPHFFENAPMVLDLGALDEGDTLPFGPLLAELRAVKLIPVAVRNAEGARQAAALEAGLGLLKGGGRALRAPAASDGGGRDEGNVAPEQSAPASAQPARDPADAEPPAEASPGDTPEIAADGATEGASTGEGETQAPVVIETPAASLTVKSPVRGGQVVYAQGTDLVLLAPVNPGGEVIADGNIHAYAPIRGRALAGAHGNEDARIFCQSLDAELISIAGHYLSADEIDARWRKKAVHVRLDGGDVVISEL
jgi:septum site-determining protein MinC